MICDERLDEHRACFVHLSDLHLSSLETVPWHRLLGKRFLGYLSWRRKRRFEHSPHVIEALTQQLRDIYPDQYVITGDLTHIGLPQEFIQAASWLRQLGNPQQIAVVPGNHDGYARESWANSYGCWFDYLASDQCSASDGISYPTLRIRDQVAFIGLSSAVPTPPLMATGALGNEQLDRLGPLLRETGRQGLFRVVYLHHPPFKKGEKWRKRLIDANELEAVLAVGGAELVLHGHAHRNVDREIEAAGRRIPVLGVASASAAGLHGESASFGVYELEAVDNMGWRLERKLWRWTADRGCFSEAGCQHWDIGSPI